MHITTLILIFVSDYLVAVCNYNLVFQYLLHVLFSVCQAHSWTLLLMNHTFAAKGT